MSDREFEWHPAKAQRNLDYHGVSFEEAATVFDDPLADIQPDIVHSLDETRFVIIGSSAKVIAGGCFYGAKRGRSLDFSANSDAT